MFFISLLGFPVIARSLPNPWRIRISPSSAFSLPHQHLALHIKPWKIVFVFLLFHSFLHFPLLAHSLTPWDYLPISVST